MITMEKTKTKEDKLDLLLEWEESASTPDEIKENGDLIDISSVLHSDAANTSEMEIKRLSDENLIISITDKTPEEHISSGEITDSPDEFHWSEELNMAIEEALGIANDIQMPIIHGQLNNIIRGLETNSLTSSNALHLTEEIENYINKHLKRREIKPPVNHEKFQNARLHIIDGLNAYFNSTDIIKKYIETRSSDYVMMAQSFADQGAEFFLKATELMLESEPSDDN